jgi:type I restriction enzyme S subunit
MASRWQSIKWGDAVSLEYGKALRGYDSTSGKYRVFGSNGPIGWTDTYLAKGPGVVLGRKGAYRGVEFSKDPFFVIDTAYFVVPKVEMDPRWLYYAIKHHKLGEIDDGSPVPSTTRAAVYVQDVQIPPLSEQRGIARHLGMLDDKIELNRKTNETLEQMARAIFKSWFIDYDPVRAKQQGKRPFGMDDATAALFPDSFEQSEIGEIPKGWRYGKLSDVAAFQSGYAFKSKDWVDSGVPVVKIGSVKPGIVDLSQVSYVTPEVAEAVPQFRLSIGDVLIGMTGYVGEVGLVPPTNNLPLINQRVGKLKPLAEDDGQGFLYFTTRQPTFKEAVETRSHGTAQANVSGSEILNVGVVVPPASLRKAFNATAMPIIQLILSNHSESMALSQTRDLLLPRLLSGELTINEGD